jgi:hypothetical protein
MAIITHRLSFHSPTVDHTLHLGKLVKMPKSETNHLSKSVYFQNERMFPKSWESGKIEIWHHEIPSYSPVSQFARKSSIWFRSIYVDEISFPYFPIYFLSKKWGFASQPCWSTRGCIIFDTYNIVELPFYLRLKIQFSSRSNLQTWDLWFSTSKTHGKIP